MALQQHRAQLIIAVFLGLFVLLSAAAASNGHNITHILAGHPSCSTFNHYLSLTHLADEINRRRTITVCAVDNDAMDALLSRHFSLPTIKNVLSLHVFADYFGSRKLHRIPKGSTTTSSLYQATGEAAGTSGYVTISDLKGGKVGFSASPDDNAPVATLVSSIAEFPYDLSVIQISLVLSSPEAEAPTASPSSINATSVMARQGCKAFSDLILAQPGAADALTQSLDSGLTVFCPSDDAVKAFMTKYRALNSDGKTSLLLYHAAPEYNSLGSLRSSNGLMNTLATEGAANKYDFTVHNDGDLVKIDTGVVTATIKGTLIDDDPFAVYKTDKVLQPKELFKAAPSSSANAKAGSGDEADATGPAGADDVPADENSSNDCRRTVGGGGGIVALMSFSSVLGILVLGF